MGASHEIKDTKIFIAVIVQINIRLGIFLIFENIYNSNISKTKKQPIFFNHVWE